jgi:branched-chain amino acid transport system substrate-binding protein
MHTRQTSRCADQQQYVSPSPPPSPIKGERVFIFLAALALTSPTWAAPQYGPGVTDTEIKVGQTMPYSGPASAYAAVGKAEVAYFHKINAEGGVNKRRIKLLSLDDAYSPPKTVEQTRRLVEHEEVLAIFGTLGTPTNAAIHKYLNAKKVPQLLIYSADMKWGDPQRYPWTIAFYPNQRTLATIYASYIIENRSDAKIGVLYQADDFGKDYLKAFKEALGPKARMIVAEASYEVSDPSIDSQIISLKSSGADTLLDISTPKFTAQAIRKIYDIDWRPMHFIPSGSTSIPAVMRPAGLEKSVGVLSAAYLKDPNDPQWKDDPAVKEWLAWMKKFYPDGDTAEIMNAQGYTAAQLFVRVLKQCGDELTRENLMKQAANLKSVELPMLLPGIKLDTSPTDYYPIKQMQMQRFDGTRWVRFGEVMGQ